MFLVHITNPKSFVFNFWGSLQYKRAVFLRVRFREAAYYTECPCGSLIIAKLHFALQKMLKNLRMCNFCCTFAPAKVKKNII